MQEIVSKRDWDRKIFATGRKVKVPNSPEEYPVFSSIIQNGLHDIEPDGRFVECDPSFEACTDGVTPYKSKRTRCGEVRIGDTASDSKQLAKIKTKRNKGISLKFKDHKTYGPFIDGTKNSRFNTDAGITIRQYPTYKGINVVLTIDNPQASSNRFTFTIKEYGCDYTYEAIDGGIRCVSSTGEDDIYIRALYAMDANGNYGPCGIDIGNVANGLQEIYKWVDDGWWSSAVGPVEFDPLVTIDDDTGTFYDTIMYDGLPNHNYGAFEANEIFNWGANKQKTLHQVDLSSYSGVTVTTAYFGFDVYEGSFPIDVDAHVVLVSWGEGNKAKALATAGESSWNHSAYPTTWNTAGCAGDGTDREATPAGSLTFSAINSDTHFIVSNASIQGMIDGTNNGFLFDYNAITGKYVKWRSNEAGLGNKPYFYMEYIEAGIIYPSIPAPVPSKVPQEYPGSTPGVNNSGSWVTI